MENNKHIYEMFILDSPLVFQFVVVMVRLLFFFHSRNYVTLLKFDLNIKKHVKEICLLKSPIVFEFFTASSFLIVLILKFRISPKF